MKIKKTLRAASTEPVILARSLSHRYTDLRAHVSQTLHKTNASVGAIQNFMTTLNAWLTILKLQNDSMVGDELSGSFDKSMTFFMDEMLLLGRSPRTVQDRCELMLRWRQYASEMYCVDSLPADFSAALVEAMRRKGFTTGEVARAAAINIQTLRAWENGSHLPKGERMNSIERLEDVLHIPRGILLKRLGMRAMTWHASRVKRRELPVTRTKFGERMSRLVKTKLRYILWPEGQLHTQWQAVIAYKTDAFRDDAKPGNSWRMKSLGVSGARLNTASVLDNQVCASADAAWGFLGSYLGWLRLPEHDGGGIPLERVKTLAWLLRDDKVLKYLAWRQRRSGVVHKGLLQVLNTACMLLRPQSGWLWRNSSLIHTLRPEDIPIVVGADMPPNEIVSVWQNECARVHAVFLARAKKLSARGILSYSRDATEPIAAILADARPLRVAIEMIATLERSPPPLSATLSCAVWLRDIVLLKLLVSNPLRVSHFSIMTYRRDNTGNIYKTTSGEWRLRFEAATFKNEKHAAQKDYDAGVPRFLWDDIERYIAEGRPNLLDVTTSEYFLLRSRAGPDKRDAQEMLSRSGMWVSEGISVRVKELTLLLRPGCPAFRTHAFRHIVATDYLKRHPGAYLNVAHLLHDKLATVMQVYGHLSVEDGLRGHFASVEDEWAAAVSS